MQTSTIRKLFVLFVGLTLAMGELAAAWSSPKFLAPSQASLGQLVIDGNGNALSVWQSNGAIQVSSLPSNGTWVVSTLATPVQYQSFGSPQIAIDQEGNAIAVWLSTALDNCGRWATTLMYSQNHCGGSWSTPTSINNIGGWLSLGGITFDPKGNATVGWFSSLGDNGFVLSSSTLPKGSTSWGDPNQISPWFLPNSIFALQSDASSNLVSMSVSSSGTFLYLFFLRPGEDYWSGPVTLAYGYDNLIVTPALAYSQGNAAASQAGVAAIVWIGSKDNAVYANSFSLSGGYGGNPSQLTSDGSINNNPAVAFDSNGNAVAVWGNDQGALYYSSMLNGQSSWSTPQLITKLLYPGTAPIIQSDGNGNIFVLWLSQYDRTYQVAMLAPNSTTWASLGMASGIIQLTPGNAALAVSPAAEAVAIIPDAGELFGVNNPNLLENQ